MAFRVTLVVLLLASVGTPLSLTLQDVGGEAAAAATGAPLRLTPLLEAGKGAEARALAAVPGLLPSCCTSYSGFLTVDKKHDSNLFFWFFRSESRPKTAPLIVWLQGGPGTSMMRPVFLENGPYQIDAKTSALRRRKGSWTRDHNVLYFDNPVGTGYSFTASPEGLATDVGQISRSLIEALDQFFVMFPRLRARDLYIAGESFGGKMAVALAHAIHRLPQPAAAPGAFNLRGLMVINGLVEVESQLDKSDLAYGLGLVDERGRDRMRDLAQQQARLVRQGRWDEARAMATDECGGVLSPRDTGLAGLTNYLLWNGTQDDGFADLAQHAVLRDALHVGNATYAGRAWAVAVALRDDIAVSSLPQLAELADQDHLRVLVASGQLDLCLPYRRSADLVRKMSWKGAAQVDGAPRVTWCERGQLAGYARSVRGLTHVLVRNAGHYLGQDQPRWAADMARRFTGRDSFDTCQERVRVYATP